ncbi:hypothetical protein BH11PSE12_BH11PSE12_16390 [soil metagenome]
MNKKSIFLGILLSSALVSTVFGQNYVSMALSTPAAQQDGRAQDGQNAASAISSVQSALMLDRSGMDKASVHLQILQQTTGHFADTVQAKRPVTDDKKSQTKPQSNS